jgi:large subunit ribosomal protein L23
MSLDPYIIRQPVITEKTLRQANTQNVYTFEVRTTADKNMIKAAIEKMYGVDVVSVNVIMRARKMKRTGQKRLRTLQPKTKKALVKLKQDQTIDVFDTGGQS